MFDRLRNPIVADVVPLAQRAQAYGLLHWVINIGFAFAAVVAACSPASTSRSCSSPTPRRWRSMA